MLLLKNSLSFTIFLIASVIVPEKLLDIFILEFFIYSLDATVSATNLPWLAFVWVTDVITKGSSVKSKDTSSVEGVISFK